MDSYPQGLGRDVNHRAGDKLGEPSYLSRHGRVSQTERPKQQKHIFHKSRG